FSFAHPDRLSRGYEFQVHARAQFRVGLPGFPGLDGHVGGGALSMVQAPRLALGACAIRRSASRSSSERRSPSPSCTCASVSRGACPAACRCCFVHSLRLSRCLPYPPSGLERWPSFAHAGTWFLCCAGGAASSQ